MGLPGLAVATGVPAVGLIADALNDDISTTQTLENNHERVSMWMADQRESDPLVGLVGDVLDGQWSGLMTRNHQRVSDVFDSSIMDESIFEMVASMFGKTVDQDGQGLRVRKDGVPEEFDEARDGEQSRHTQAVQLTTPVPEKLNETKQITIRLTGDNRDFEFTAPASIRQISNGTKVLFVKNIKLYATDGTRGRAPVADLGRRRILSIVDVLVQACREQLPGVDKLILYYFRAGEVNRAGHKVNGSTANPGRYHKFEFDIASGKRIPRKRSGPKAS